MRVLKKIYSHNDQMEAIERAQNKETIGITGYNKEEASYDVYRQGCHQQKRNSINISL